MPDNEIRTRGCFAMVAAGFQRHIERGTGDIFRCALNRIDFRVILTAALMIPLADDSFILDQNGADHRIGAGVATALGGQFYGQFHIVFIIHGDFITSLTKPMQRNLLLMPLLLC
jgi:hypothetical protein